jgi:hypothetical protein
MSGVPQNTDETIYKGNREIVSTCEAKFEFPLLTPSFFSM